MVETPPETSKEINDIILNFIWEGNTANIAQNTLIMNINRGRLKLCHFLTNVS